MKAVQIHHFSDVLCVWAYVGQARVDELCEVHGDEIALHYHYVDVFGDVPGRLTERWSEKGGLAAYSQHVIDVVAGFEHVEVHEDVWKKAVPNSSMSCHQFLHGVGLAVGQDAQMQAAWALREAFFAQARDVSQRRVQFEIAEAIGASVEAIEKEICSGAALARVSRDLKMAAEQSISVSPTLVFNEGRQMLKGNVNFRVIEANVKELLSVHEASHSWC